MVEMATKPARMRTVETKTVEEVPIEAPGSQSLGKPWQEWLRDRTPDELAITEVSIYRYEPASMRGFLEKLGGFNNNLPCEAIDEGWIATRYGGGTYGVKIYSKDGKSSFDPKVIVAGEPKVPKSQQAAATPPAPGDNGESPSLVDVLERMIERLQHQQTPPPAVGTSQGAKEIIETMSALEDLRHKVNPAPPAPKSALEDLSSILQIVDKLKPPPPPPPVESPLQKALLDAVIAQVTQPKKSLIDELEGLGKLLPLIQNFAGGGDKGDWKTALIEKGLERVPDIIDGVGKVMDKRVSEAQALAVREQARAQTMAIARGAAAASPIPAGPVPGVQTSAKPAEPAEPAPWRPLSVVPIDGHPPAAQAPNGDAHYNVHAPAEVIPPGVAITDEQARAAAAIDAYLKNRVVQLVAQHAEAALVVDFIDSASPELGAMLSQATESQIQAFISEDPVLKEIEGLPHYRAFLAEFLEVLHEAPEPARVH
jgi:hypothetical protein